MARGVELKLAEIRMSSASETCGFLCLQLGICPGVVLAVRGRLLIQIRLWLWIKMQERVNYMQNG